jgi:hypothetical protein
MEFHPDPAKEEEEMRPLHLVLRNVLEEAGLRRREGGQRRGDWKFVSPSCRAHFLFSWRSKMGADGLASRPADASSEERPGVPPEPQAVCGLTPPPSHLSQFAGFSPSEVRDNENSCLPP